MSSHLGKDRGRNSEVKFRIFKFLRNNLTLGNRLSEFFYGVMMVVILTGLINTGLPPTQSTLRLLLIGSLWSTCHGESSTALPRCTGDS